MFKSVFNKGLLSYTTYVNGVFDDMKNDKPTTNHNLHAFMFLETNTKWRPNSIPLLWKYIELATVVSELYCTSLEEYRKMCQMAK